VYEETGTGGQRQVCQFYTPTLVILVGCARNSGLVTFWSQFAAICNNGWSQFTEARMKVLFGLAIGVLASQLGARATTDETAIRSIVEDEIVTWNEGDAVAYSRHFATDGTFTNITGQFFTGYEAFLKQHEVIFAGRFRQTRLQQDIVSLKFVRPDVAVVEVLTSVTGVVAAELAPGTGGDAKGRLRTRLLQVVVKQGEEWKVVAYHNVDVTPGIPLPEPR
jgi:uncharacterized protein (TIGR02246 family)